ncbi:MAG: AEC family transporter [Christensenellaceae bacterium]|jgi:predicted permease
MLDAVQIVITILAIIAVGYGVAKKGWITERVAMFISKIVVLFGVPASALDNILSNFTKKEFLSAGIGILLPFFIVGIGFLLGYLVARLCRIAQGSRGVFATMFACSNTIFIGLPVCQALFGEMATTFVLLYDLGHAALFWTLGAYAMQKDGEFRRGEESKGTFFSLETIKKIFSPGVISMMLAVAILFLDIQLPMFLSKTFRYLGNLCTPMALIYIGYILQKNGFRNLRIGKGTWGVLLGRVLVIPLLAYGVLRLFQAPVDMSRVFIAQAAMPVMSSTPLVAAEYGSDVELATESMTITMFVSFLLLPLLSMLLQGLGA